MDGLALQPTLPKWEIYFMTEDVPKYIEELIPRSVGSVVGRVRFGSPVTFAVNVDAEWHLYAPFHFWWLGWSVITVTDSHGVTIQGGPTVWHLTLKSFWKAVR